MNSVQDLLNYESNIQFPDFPLDDSAYMEELVRLASDWLEKTETSLPDVIPAIPTLYNPDWSIDYESLEDMMQTQKEAWVEWVLIAWTTWESSFLDHEEQIDYIKKAVEIWKRLWLKILAWAWSNYTKEQQFLTSWSMNVWANATLLLPPYYIKCSDTDLVRHFTEWLNNWPAIIYSIFWRTWMKISVEVLKILSKHPNFLWVKECDWSEKIVALKKEWIRVWTWNCDSSFSDIHREWADWTITVVWNIDPTLMLKVREWIKMTKSEIDRLMQLSHLMFLPWQPNPKPLHNATIMTRRVASLLIEQPVIFRLPGWPLSPEQQGYLAKWLDWLWIEAKPFGDNYKLIS